MTVMFKACIFGNVHTGIEFLSIFVFSSEICKLGPKLDSLLSCKVDYGIRIPSFKYKSDLLSKRNDLQEGYKREGGCREAVTTFVYGKGPHSPRLQLSNSFQTLFCRRDISLRLP